MENFDLVQELKLELIRGYEKYVRSVAALTDASEDDAREAVHRAICRMLVGLKKRAPGDPIVAWRPYIIEAAVNELRMEARRRKGFILVSDLDLEGRRELLWQVSPEPTPSEQAERNELARLAWQELRILSPQEREVITLRCRGFSFAEIASRLGTTIGAARVSWSTGMVRLRRRFRRAA